jgi:Tfp pilus assembly protein FimT
MELILVLSVISAVLALSAPMLRGFFVSRQTADSANVLLSLTKWARSEAITRGHPCRINIDPKEGTFWLTVQEGGAFVPLGSDIGRTFTVPEGAAIALQTPMPAASDAAYVQFYPSGRSDVATILITGRGGEVYRVTCPSASEPFRLILPTEEVGS